MNGSPSTLNPAGAFAQPLSDLSWLLIVTMTLVLGIVAIVTVLAIIAPARLKRVLGKPSLVIIGGLVFPGVVVSALLVWSLGVTDAVAARRAPDDLRIHVAGEMWWWRVTYFEDDRALFQTANEIRIPVGRTVAFELSSNDVIHSFWVPQLGGKMDMIPGRTNLLRLQAEKPGIYRGQCAEFCGAGHALMAMEVVAMAPDEFEAWASRQAEPAEASGAGWNAFADNGCAACHTIAGTPADGKIGPDLTHIGTRRTLAAGILPHDPATLRRFIAHAGDLKPGVRMPNYDRLGAEDLEAIASWLEGLR